MGKFKALESAISGLVLIEPTVFGDERGFFMETYSERDFAEIGIVKRFVQDNHSKSRKGVLRGLHFQRHITQGKLVRVTAGAVRDVAVDLRPESETFGKWQSFLLSADNKNMLYIPPRFAHGYLTLEEGTEFQYKCTEFYHPQYDCGVLWSDADLAVDWGVGEDDILLSHKDRSLPRFAEIDWKEVWK